MAHVATSRTRTLGGEGAARAAYAVWRRAVLGDLAPVGVVGALLIGMALLTGALWPSLSETMSEIPEQVRDVLAQALPGGDLTTAVGWTNVELVSLVLPLGVLAVAITGATRAVAGEEQTRTLGVTLAAPVSRTSFLLAKAAAVLAHLVLLSLLVAVGLVLASLAGDLGLDAAGVVGTSLHALGLGAAFGGLALLAGAATGDRRLTTAISAGVAGLAFLVSTVAPLFDSVAGLARVSPWYYFNAAQPLAQGPDPVHLLVLAALAVTTTAAAVAVFARRDLRG